MDGERPSRDELLMQTAQVWARRSTCSRAQVGVVIAREGRILVTGYNGAPAGVKHCVHDSNESSSEEGRDSTGCTVSVHAEANAIAYAAHWGISLKDTTLYTTLSPCRSCAMLILNAGITEVIVDAEYRDPGGLEMLRAGGFVKVFTANYDYNIRWKRL